MTDSDSIRKGRRHHPFLHDLYPRLTSFTSLLAAAKAAQRGKRFRPDVLAFNSRLEAELFQLQEELRSFRYQPGPYRRFAIQDPKPRIIAAAPYRDRVVHHALCAAIAPPLERRFLRTTFANRLGYGSHRALRCFHRACRSHRWVLTADIRLYFPSIDHQLLMGQLAQVIACQPTLWLLGSILANGAEPAAAIDAFPGDTLLTPLERPRGLPIGNLTSQFLANFHLDRFDHRVHRLHGIGAYLRYVDDFALFASSRAAYRNSNHPGNHNDNVGFRVCCLPPAPFTARAVGWESRGSARRVQTRSRDPRHPAGIRTAPAGWGVGHGPASAPFFLPPGTLP